MVSNFHFLTTSRMYRSRSSRYSRLRSMYACMPGVISTSFGAAWLAGPFLGALKDWVPDLRAFFPFAASLGIDVSCKLRSFYYGNVARNESLESGIAGLAD